MFTCQKCREPLKVNSKPVKEESVTAFQSSYPLPPHLDADHKRQEKAAIDLLAESFVLLPAMGASARPQQKFNQSTDLYRKVTALTQIFEVASDKCQYDHPLCTDCNTDIFKELDRQLKELESERSKYSQFLEELEQEERNQPEPDESRFLAEEKQLEEKLIALASERAQLGQELEAVDEEERNLEEFEMRFWEDYQDFELNLEAVNEEHTSLTQRVYVAERRLERMRKTNVYDDAFHISYDGHFGTINGFRLGRLTSQPVDWVETNAALGQVLLLVHTIANRINFNFSRYRLFPMGSFSKMSKIDDSNTKYELYGSNDLSLGRLFWYRRFDTALVWLLFCIKELSDHASEKDPRFKQRYEVKNDTIGGLSIKLQINGDAKWTKALKFMLITLKYLLAWMSKRTD